MKLFLFLIPALLSAQITPTLTLPATAINPGQTAVISVNITSPAGGSPSAVQWTTTYNAALWPTMTTAIGPVATAAGKILTCNPGIGTVTCSVDGPNQTAIANGVIATITLTLSAAAPVGTTPLALVAPVASDGAGTKGGLAITAPPVGNVTISAVISACDLNADGATNQLDVVIGRNQALGIAACGNGDLDKDGKCTVVDVQRLQNAATGAACRIG